MTAIIVDAPPFNPVIPYVQVGTAPDTVNFECAASDLEVSPDQDETTTTTFCGSYTTYKAETWTITATVYPSYGPDGLWNALRPLVGMVLPFEVRPSKDDPVSETNPSMTGVGIIKAFAFYMGATGEPKSFDLEIAVQGTPEWTYTPGASTLSRRAGDDEEVEDDEVVEDDTGAIG